MNRKYSLKKNQDIERLVHARISVGNRYYAIYYNKAKETKIAFSISKKCGKAVIRNYEKRVAREIARKNLESIEGLKLLLVIKASAVMLDYEEKKEKIEELFSKIRRRNDI